MYSDLKLVIQVRSTFPPVSYITYMDVWMLGCLVFVFSCILANVTAIILVSWKKEKREKREKAEKAQKALREEESSDAIGRIFNLNDMLETPEMKQRNGLNMRNPACFPVGPFYLCTKTLASAAAESEQSKVYLELLVYLSNQLLNISHP